MLYTIIPYEVIFEKRDDIPTNYIELKMGNKQCLCQDFVGKKFL